MKKLIVLTFSLAALTFAAVAAAGYFTQPLPKNHHIHDCTKTPPSSCVYPHLAVGFFPIILGELRDDYLNDPAECNDATDKALLPPNDGTTPTENQPLRAGVCYTKTTVIHMRTIDANDPAPAGWSGPISPVHLPNDVTYVTYWLLTPR